MQNETIPPENTRSTFVTVLAWVFITIAGFMTLIALLQNIMINTMADFDQMPVAGRDGQQIPALFRFMLEHMRLFIFSFLVVCTTTLISAVGLLHRKDWARRVFIGILVLGIAWNLGNLVIQQYIFSSMSTFPANTPPDFRAEFERMTSIMQTVSIFIALGFSVLFGWLIKRLVSEPIRAEFTQTP